MNGTEIQARGAPFWENAYREHGPSILSFLRRRLPSPDEAEDLLQETFVRAIRTPEPLEDPAKARSYLFTTAHNLLVNHLRRSDAKVTEAELQRIEEEVARASSDSRVQVREIRERLEVVLDLMTDPERKAFEAAVIRNESYSDIASRLGWSREQVKVNVFRARKRAMREMGDLLDRVRAQEERG